MTRQEQLETITRARAILAEHYIPWLQKDGHGGHCHLGALRRALEESASPYTPYDGILNLIDDAATRLHPELKGRIAERPMPCFFSGPDHFDQHPGVFVNNHLGKGAILEVYDDAIAQLEVAILCEAERAANQAPESSTAPSGSGALVNA